MEMFSCRCGWRMPESNTRAIAAHKAGRDCHGFMAGTRRRPRISAVRGDESKAMQRYRCQLFSTNPHCYWCGRLTVWDTPANGILQPDSATIDHVVSRFNRSKNGLTDIVLACYECNARRCQKEQQDRLETRRQAGMDGEELGQ